MINLKVFKLSTLINKTIKIIISFIILLIFVLLMFKNVQIINKNSNNIKKYILNNNLIFCERNSDNYFFIIKKKIINYELSFINCFSLNLINKETIKDSVEEEIELNVKNNTDINIEENIKEDKNTIQSNISTQIIAENNKKDVFTNEFDGIKIKNESSYNIDNISIKNNIEYSKSKNIIIYHTHTCESYTPTNENSYIASGNFRTLDLKHSVVRVGESLKENLSKYDYNVIHDYTYHDYPAYNGSYNRSLITIENILKKCKDSKMIIDLHRDALGSNSKYSPCVKIENEIVAQLMFVIGTNGGGLEHENWQKNLSFACKIQSMANKMYPGLFKPMIIRDSRYNQHVSDFACIIEVGATGNTIEECNNSMKYLASVLNEVFK